MKIALIVQEMATSEILNIIPANFYEQIKRQDPHPLFKAFVIGHEGESRGKLAVGGRSYGDVIKRWAKTAIQQMFQKIKMGLELFHGHDDPAKMNAHDGREQIGEVVGKDLREIDGRLSTVVISYIYPQYRNLKLDTASIEAFINADINDPEKIDVESITGIALADKNHETPGFPHAGLLAQLQAFTENQSPKGEDMDKLTIGKIIDYAKTEKLRPSDIFKEAELTDDPIVEKIVKSEKSGEYHHRQRTDDKFQEESEKWEKEKEEMQNQIKDLKSQVAKTSIDDMLKAEIESRKLSDQEAKFIKRNIEKFKVDNPEDQNAMKRDLSKFADDQIDEFNELQKDVFGVDQKQNDDETDNEPVITGDAKTSDIDKNDMIPD